LSFLAGKDLFVLADVNVYDTRRFAEEYVPQTAEIKNNGQVNYLCYYVI